jgi:hypothetical protein
MICSTAAARTNHGNAERFKMGTCCPTKGTIGANHEKFTGPDHLFGPQQSAK